MGTMAERWLQEGRQEGLRKGLQEGLQKGRQEGRQEGWQEGRQEGEANTLVRLLERRFGAVPDSVRKRVATASPEQIDTWLDTVIDAESLDEVFGGAGDSPEEPA